MGILAENLYNKRTSRSEATLKVWRYAGLMLTYKCSAACRFCYYHCSPESGGLMPVDMGLSAWSSLVEMSDSAAKIHITGGEPFLYFDHLVELVTKAQSVGLKGFDSVETNGSWAIDRKIVIERMKLLDSVGMEQLRISWDPFHAEFVDVDRVRLLADTAEEVLGKGRVLVRWAKYLQFPVKSGPFSAEERKELYVSTVADPSMRFTGRAGEELADLFADRSLEDLSGENCSKSFLGSKGVHIDPYGNVFSGLCSGIIVGNVNIMPLDEIWRGFDPSSAEFFGTVFAESPMGLLDDAIEMGYEPKPVYSGKCHLCTDLRSFFFDKGILRPIIGPADCYGRRSEEKVMEHV